MKNYQEPISRAPIYNPAWITFLFPVGYFICPDNKEPLNISLEQINSNNYKGSMFQEVVTTIELENSELKALISYDGALAIPMCSAFPNASIALDTINKIEGAQMEYRNLKKSKCDGRISERYKILVEMDYISSSELEVLDLARKQRNGLAHSGTLPKFEVVEKLWFTLLGLLERYSNVALSELRSRTSAGEGKFNKYYPPGFTNKCDINRAEFPEWPKKKEM